MEDIRNEDKNSQIWKTTTLGKYKPKNGNPFKSKI